MPKQNRAFVRDGRLQVKKKRTDRSYLGAQPPSAAPVAEPGLEDQALSPDEESPVAAPAEPIQTEVDPAPVAAPAEFSARGRPPAAVRAIQQQGVRKRGELDVEALAIRDTQYALHELRRIAILATMVIVTLVVLGIVLR